MTDGHRNVAGTPANSQMGTWEQAVAWIRTQPEHSKLVVDAYYDDPLSAAAERYWRSEEWAAVRAWLPAERTWALDVGAGRGIASYALAKEGFGVQAIEPDNSALVGAEAIRSLARESALRIEVTQEFSERLPFADATIDLVFARAVLHHTVDMSAACREFYRVLKPGGRLLAIREHVISRPEDLPAFHESHPLHRIYGGENAFMLSEYIDAIQSVGFRIASVLAPFDSVMNYAPRTLEAMQAEIAAIAGSKMRMLEPIVRGLLAVPGVWAVMRRLLKHIDKRPGRHYSFVADKL